ncbi:MAG: hypothetical protein ACLPPF_22230 [Rhodomicrobium sp.]
MPGVKESPDLAEVKAVLRSLQRLDLPEADALDSGETGWTALRSAAPPPPSEKARAGMSVFDRKRAAIVETEPTAGSRRRGPTFIAVVAGAIAAGAILFWFYRPAGVPSEPNLAPAAMGPVLPAQPRPVSAANEAPAGAQPEENVGSVLSEARRLLSEGETALARTRLLRGSPAEHADLALLLAQSYDPIYLRTLPKANALPDKAEAIRWYKTWYELAARNGLEMDKARFQRIISHLQ